MSDYVLRAWNSSWQINTCSYRQCMSQTSNAECADDMRSRTHVCTLTTSATTVIQKQSTVRLSTSWHPLHAHTRLLHKPEPCGGPSSPHLPASHVPHTMAVLSPQLRPLPRPRPPATGSQHTSPCSRVDTAQHGCAVTTNPPPEQGHYL